MPAQVQNAEAIIYPTVVNLETIRCCECSVLFAIPQQLKEHLEDSGDWFYCPNGHRQHYTKTTIQRLKEELEQKKRFLEYGDKRLQILQDRNTHLSNTLRVTKGHATRVKNKYKELAGGVCPCCKKEFKNLADHMKELHPEELGGE